MANSFLSVRDFARAALPRLMEHLVFPNLIHRDYSDDFAGKLGDTIRVRKPIVLTAHDFDPAVGVSEQDIEECAVDVTLDRIATVDVGIEALQGATCVGDVERVFIEPAAAALAKKINADGLQLYKDVPSFVGEAGKTPSTLTILAEARKQLNRQNVPVSGRVALWDAEADAAFTALDAIVHAEKSGSTEGLREGSIGRVMGLDNFMSQSVCVHEAGSLTASGNITVKTAVTDADTIVLSGTSLTGTVKQGDLLVIGDKKTQHTVLANAAASGNAISVKVSPKITCAAGTTVQLIGSHTANLAFHPMAFAFVTRPLPTPGGVESYTTHYNGISLRVVRGYDMVHKKELLSMDVLYGFKTMYPELATRVLG
jgi:hypothetical protein